MSVTSIVTCVPSVTPFAGGVNSVANQNLVYNVIIGGAWNVGDKFQFDIVTQALTYTCGIGYVTGTVPAMALTLRGRVHFVSGYTWYFSDNDDATTFDQQGPGAGFIQISNQFSSPEPLVALTQYQGMMCVQSRRTTQIWTMDANPTNFSLFQTLANIGTFANLGPVAMGELDVIFPYDSGIRAVRAKDVTLNAVPTDIGSALDTIISPTILGLTSTQLQACCGIVEPLQGRYWIFIPNTDGVSGEIYVLSYFPSNKIVAWSRYNTTYNTIGATVNPTSSDANNRYYTTLTVGGLYQVTGSPSNPTTITTSGITFNIPSGTTYSFVAKATSATLALTSDGHTPAITLLSQTNFLPQKFVVYNGQTYISTSTALLSYGGSNNNTYDLSPPTLQIPFYDEKRPGHQKESTHIDTDLEGTWQMSATPNWISGQTTPLGIVTRATFDQGNFPFQDKGSHFTVRFDGLDSNYMKVSSILLYYQLAEEPGS